MNIEWVTQLTHLSIISCACPPPNVLCNSSLANNKWFYSTTDVRSIWLTWSGRQLVTISSVVIKSTIDVLLAAATAAAITVYSLRRVWCSKWDFSRFYCPLSIHPSRYCIFIFLIVNLSSLSFIIALRFPSCHVSSSTARSTQLPWSILYYGLMSLSIRRFERGTTAPKLVGVPLCVFLLWTRRKIVFYFFFISHNYSSNFLIYKNINWFTRIVQG